MSEFNVGDKVKVVSTEGILGERLPVIGNIYKIVRVSDCGEYFKVEGFDVTGNWMNSDCVAIPANDSPKEITLNGATYVLKEEPNPEHEWKFGDWARHHEYGVVFVGNVNGPDEIWCVIQDGDGWHHGQHVSPNNLTYISSATIPE